MPENLHTCGVPVPHPQHLWDDNSVSGHVSVAVTRYCAGVPFQPAVTTRPPSRRAACGSVEPHAPHANPPQSQDKSWQTCTGLTGRVPDDHDKIIQLRIDLDNAIAEVDALKMQVAHQRECLIRSLKALEEALQGDENTTPV